MACEEIIGPLRKRRQESSEKLTTERSVTILFIKCHPHPRTLHSCPYLTCTRPFSNPTFFCMNRGSTRLYFVLCSKKRRYLPHAPNMDDDNAEEENIADGKNLTGQRRPNMLRLFGNKTSLKGTRITREKTSRSPRLPDR